MPDLSGCFDSGFFSHLILQVSQVEPSVRHAVIALGSLFQRFDVNASKTMDANLADAQHHFAIHQYNQVVRHLVWKMSEESVESIEIMLIVCILFICIELLQGSPQKAITHLERSLSIILQNWRTTHNHSGSTEVSVTTPTSQSVKCSVLETFSRLHIQAGCLGPASPQPTPTYYCYKYEAQLCPNHSNLSDARLGLDNCMHVILKFVRSAFHCRPQSPGTTMFSRKCQLELQLWQ